MEKNPSTEPVLVLLADNATETATARDLKCNLVHLHKPGTAAEGLVIPDENFYTVDYTDLGAFERFVDAVLRPLSPHTVVPLDEDTALAGALCNQWLGLPGLQPQTVEACNSLTARANRPRTGSGEGQVQAPDLTVASFTIKGIHQVIAAIEHFCDGPDYAVTPPASFDSNHVTAASDATIKLLYELGVTDGPATFDYRFVDGSPVLSRVAPMPPQRALRGVVLKATGVNLERWSLGWPLELGTPAPDDTIARAAARIRVAVPGLGAITDLVENLSSTASTGVHVELLQWDRMSDQGGLEAGGTACITAISTSANAALASAREFASIITQAVEEVVQG